MRYEDLTNSDFNLIEHLTDKTSYERKQLIGDNDKKYERKQLIGDDDKKFVVSVYIRNYGFDRLNSNDDSAYL